MNGERDKMKPEFIEPRISVFFFSKIMCKMVINNKDLWKIIINNKVKDKENGLFN